MRITSNLSGLLIQLIFFLSNLASRTNPGFWQIQEVVAICLNAVFIIDVCYELSSVHCECAMMSKQQWSFNYLHFWDSHSYFSKLRSQVGNSFATDMGRVITLYTKFCLPELARFGQMLLKNTNMNST